VSAEYGVFLGLDVGKSDHHAVALAPDGKRLYDAPLPNTEVRLRALFDKLARHGRILVVVDQPASVSPSPPPRTRAGLAERLLSATRGHPFRINRLYPELRLSISSILVTGRPWEGDTRPRSMILDYLVLRTKATYPDQTTTLTRRPLTTITFFGVRPASTSATSASAASRTESSVVSGATSTRPRTLPFTCTG